jgi:hypothetical protein
MSAQPFEELVAVRRRWNSTAVGHVRVPALRDLQVRNEPGGVCGPLPRPFLFAHIWCDSLVSGDVGHVCREGPPPHEVVVCITQNDNPGPLYSRLRGLARR